jgi:hypothetical protein
MTDNNNNYISCLYPQFTPRTSYDKGCRCDRCKYCRQNYAKQRWQNVLKPKYHANKQFYRDKAKKWRTKNLQKIREQSRLYAQKQRQINPLVKIKENLRTRLNKFIKKKNKSKNLQTILGCSYDDLRIHLEKKFYSIITWDNYGSIWCIDHIIPLASAKNQEEIEKLNHYTNLQPLLIEDNLRKGKKLLQ